MSQFYFALTNPEAEGLLKEEVKLYYPELRLSYSRPGFLTFKSEKSIHFAPYFARVAGNCLGKFKASELKVKKAWAWKREDSFELPADLVSLSESSLFKVGERATLVMMVGAEEFWVGEYELTKIHFQTPGEVSSIIEKEVPSRAYYKIAEAFEAFDLPFKDGERVLELGSAPGGASLFLLEQDLKVIGVDPAEMDAGVLKHPNFRHLKKPFETITDDNFRDHVDWIVSDINLPPTVVLREVERLLGFLEPRGLILTLKINQEKHLRLLKHLIGNYQELGFNRAAIKYLPSHRQEIAVVAMKA